MSSWIEKQKEKWRIWVISKAQTRQAQFWLAAFAFAESSFFLIPPDLLLIAILAAGAGRFVYYAGLTTLFSVLGALFGYLIGFLFFDLVGVKLVAFYHLEGEMARVGELFSRGAFPTIFLAAFTPIPFKVFTLSAGLFKINLLTFVWASILGRGARFLGVAYLARCFGPFLGNLIYRYFNWFSIAVGILLIFLLIVLV